MHAKKHTWVRRAAALLLALTIPLLLLACGNNGEDETVEYPNGTDYPVVTIELEDGGKIYAELYPDIAPNTVNNFISLVKSGYYDGKVFHRAVSGFMIQGGSPDGTGSSAGFPYAIYGEFSNNGFKNDLKHERGVLSMARLGTRYLGEDPAPYYDTASAQFFIMHANYPSLDGDYATFGKVFHGMDVVDKIATSATNSSQILLEKVVIKKITVETFDKTYAEPETIA